MIKESAFDQKIGTQMARVQPRVLSWLPAAAIGALAAGVCVTSMSGGAQGGETPITCTNPVSGATWQIRIDYDRSTVDSNPARISDTKISWHDAADGGNYTLDRKSGNLTVIVASSTGGFFLYDRCKLEN
jgi:hypothetical protein